LKFHEDVLPEQLSLFSREGYAASSKDTIATSLFGTIALGRVIRINMQRASSGSVSAARSLAMAVFVALVAGGCGGPARVPVPRYDADGMAKAAMAEYDKNGDGKLDEKELEASPALKNALNNINAAGERKSFLTEEDIAERLRLFKQANVGLRGVRCSVTRGNELVQGVTVTYVPEAFMGGVVKAGTAVSDKMGIAAPRVEGEDVDGVSLGFYKIELSLKDSSGKETLPAKYNTSTVFGQEVHHRRGLLPVIVNLE